MKGNTDHLTQRKGGTTTKPESAKMQGTWPAPREKGRRSGDDALRGPIQSGNKK